MNFLVVGTIRNCEKTIVQTINSLSESLNWAEKVEYFFVESDSKDKSVDILMRLKNEIKHFDFETHGDLCQKMKSRTSRLAFCRNRYLSYQRKYNKYLSYYLIVVDMDGVFQRFECDLFSEINAKWNWAVMTANVRGRYYDIWALREDNWSPNDCWLAAKESQIMGLNKYQSYFNNVYSRMLIINKKNKNILVKSAFGGLAIYKIASIPKQAEYLGINSDGEEICEHINFHESIYYGNLGKIFINPRLIIGPSPLEHIKYAGIIGRKLFWLRCVLVSVFKYILNLYLSKQRFKKKIRSLILFLKNKFLQ